MNLTKTNWPGGWNPSTDPVNGDPNSLVRMDNLQQDEQGVTGIVRGIQEVSGPFGNYVSDIFTAVIGGSEVIYNSISGNGQAVYRNSSQIAAGNDRAAFGSGLGQVFVSAGNIKVKDDGGTTRQWGLKVPGDINGLSIPGVVANSQPSLQLNGGTWTSIEGHDFTGSGLDGAKENVDSTTLRGVVLLTFTGALDTTTVGSGPSPNPDDDTFSLLFQLHDSNLFTSFTVDIILDKDPTAPENYYTKTFTIGTDPGFILGVDQQSILSCRRSDFTRLGTDTKLDWTTVTGFRVTAQALADTWFLVNQQEFVGGVNGQLYGLYVYAQVNKYDNGTYVARSPISGNSPPVYCINGTVTVTPATSTDAQVTAIDIYRMSIGNSTNPKIASFLVDHPNTPALLNQFYYVGTTAVGAAFIDTTSDLDAIEQNLTPNLFLTSVQDIQESILGIEGIYYERMLLMSFKALYLSDRLNPDAVDSRYTIKAFGDTTEKNLWIKRLTNNIVVLGTTKNLYALSGTFLDLPDGTIDIQVTPIGEQYPPLCSDVCSVDGSIFYVAADGIRVTNGSNSIPISPQLNLLFQGESRSGIPPVAIYPDNAVRYGIACGKSKLYAALPMQDGTRLLFIYNFISKTWRMQYTDPISIWVTQSDRVLGAYAVSSLSGLPSGYIFEFEKGVGVSGPGISQGQMIFLRTVFDANAQPRNRKDTFTLKLVLDTGGADVDVYIGKDGVEPSYIATVNTSGLTTKYIDLHTVTLGFRYAIILRDKNLLTIFKLYELTIEYDARPEQVNYLRLPNTNLGSYSRKRFTSFACIIDTLGNTISFTPYIDNVAQTADTTVITPTKLTHITFFNQETIGTDIGGIFSGGVFEFYQVNLEETVSEKLPTPTTFLVIPNNDYGSPNRKRHSSYKFQINTRGADVTFIPILDGVSYSARTFNTTTKRVVEYFFNTNLGDIIGIDIGGTLASTGIIPFEFYGVVTPQDIELLPPRLEFFKIPNNNLGSSARKRFIAYAFVIDTYGANVTFTCLVDNVSGGVSTFTVNTAGKVTYIAYFTAEVIGTDIGGTLVSVGSQPFEFYGINLSECISEKMPPPAEYLVIPANDYGTPHRKRHTSYKFQINTRGGNVTFLPTLDGVQYSGTTFNTTQKRVVEYFFDTGLGDVIGIDIAGTLIATDRPFEFYGVITPENVEVLPSRLEFFRIPNDNLGVASRKRVRTLPLVIDTYGKSVTFQPIVDGVAVTPYSSFVTTGKTTVFHYFVTDVFGVDFGGTLSSGQTGQPFEFYGLGQPEDVEVLPVGKRFDQLGPQRFDKIGKLFAIRIKLIMTGSTTTLPVSIYTDLSTSQNDPANTSPLFQTNIPVIPGLDEIYELQLPKSINGSIFRIVLGPTVDPFHRYDMWMRVATSGMETDAKWVPVR